MEMKKYLWILPLLIIGGCDSESDDVTITNNYITEAPIVTTSVEQEPIGQFELQTTVETDFFVVVKDIDSLEKYYSNSNTFHFDEDGYLVNSLGYPLLAFPVNYDGSSSSVSLSTSAPVKVDYQGGNPKATDSVSIGANLPESDGELPVNEFDHNNPLTFNNSTSVSVFDSIGESHILSFYFIHVNVDSNTWELRVTLDGNAVQPVTEQTLDFNQNGLLDINDDDLDGFLSTGNGKIDSMIIPLSNGANDLSITLDFTSDTTSFNSNFAVTSLGSSGFYTDHIKEFKIDSDGLITLLYIHQEDQVLARVAMVKFQSPYNLEPLANSLWAETEDSGSATAGEAETKNFGSFVPVVYDY